MYRDRAKQPLNVSYNGTIILQRCKISRKILKGKKFSTFFKLLYVTLQPQSNYVFFSANEGNIFEIYNRIN